MAKLTSTCGRRDGFEKAGELDSEVVALRKKVFEYEYVSTLESMKNFAITPNQQNRPTEADEILIRAIGSKKKI
jgi:hypothetical protein